MFREQLEVFPFLLIYFNTQIYLKNRLKMSFPVSNGRYYVMCDSAAVTL